MTPWKAAGLKPALSTSPPTVINGGSSGFQTGSTFKIMGLSRLAQCRPGCLSEVVRRERDYKEINLTIWTPVRTVADPGGMWELGDDARSPKGGGQFCKR